MRRIIFASALAVTLLTAAARAQLFESEHPQSQPINFSPAEKSVLDRLDSFRLLPGDEWRFHAGDIAHGESPALDDSSWPIMRPRSKAGKEAVWYRRTIEVPRSLHGYDLTGATISFQFRDYANGPMPMIVYFNGRRVAMGDDLEAITLFDNAKPGEKVLVAVKLLETVDDKNFNSVVMRVQFALNRPNPEDLRQEFVVAAAVVPSLAPGDKAKRDQLLRAVSDVNLTALDKGNQAAFDASLVKAQADMMQLRPLLQTATLHLTGNSHIDAAWLWPWTETVDVVKRTFGTALQLMREYPSYTYTQSAAAYSQWMADKYPQANAEIAQRVKEGRWELVGGMWLEPDLNMPDGESLVRQLLVGQKTFETLYGKRTRIGWNPDSFGYNWQLPQIYKRSGIDYFVTQKMFWNDTNKLPLKLFWWQSPDGSKVLTYFPHDYANDNLDPTRLGKDLAQARNQAPGMLQMMDLYGVGDHGGGPTRQMLDEGLHWMQPDKAMPKEIFGTAQSYFTGIEGKVSPNSPLWDYKTLAAGKTQLPEPPTGEITIPTWKDELYLEYHRGVFTTQADHKKSMRDSEEWLLDAEKVASLAWLDGQRYPADELTGAWKHVLFNQFHDLAAGSGIGSIYKEAQKDYAQVRWATDEVSEKSLSELASHVNTQGKEGVPVLVFNSLAWNRPGFATVKVQMPGAVKDDTVSLLDAHGNVVPSQSIHFDQLTHTYTLLFRVADVPSLGYTTLRAVPGERKAASDLKASGLTIENANLKLTVDGATGCITSLVDKQSGFDSIAKGGCGNELQAFKDTPKQYDAWNVDPGTYDVPPTLIHDVKSVKLISSGPLAAVIRVERAWQSSTFTQDITLFTGAHHVEIGNTIDWHETHVLLKAAFPLAASSDHATYEIPYGTIDRPTTRNNSFEKAMFEVPALRWADEGDGSHGLAILNNSKYGYDAVGNQLRLTLLRSPTWPDPVADRQVHHFTYGLYPHAGDWKQALVERRGYEFNYALKAMQVAPHEGAWPAEHSFVSVDADNVVLTAVKKAEDNSLVFRFFEWAGKSRDVTLTVPDGATSATLTNLMEQPEGRQISVSGGKVSVPVTPFQIQTVEVQYKH